MKYNKLTAIKVNGLFSAVLSFFWLLNY